MNTEPTNDDLVEALSPHLSWRRFAAGHVLWREGDVEGLLILVRRGRIKAYRTLHGGREVPLYLFDKGDLFGFMPLLDGRRYPASAVTVDEVEIGVLGRSRLQALLRTDPGLSAILLSALARRLREAMAQIQLLSTRGSTARVAAAMVAMLDDPHVRHGHSVVSLPVSAHDLSEALNLTPPTLSRSLTELVEAGVLHRLGSGRFQVLDPEGLRLRGQEGVREGMCTPARCSPGWS